MPGGRKSPALFELIRDAKGVPTPGAPRPPTPVAPAPSTPIDVPPPEPRPAPMPAARNDTLDRTLHVPMSAIYLSIAGVLLVVLIIWAIAYRSGASQEKAKSEQELRAVAGTKLQDPLKTAPTQIPNNPSLVSPRPAPTPTQPAKEPPVPANTGSPFGIDPRQVGLNYYLVEGRLDRESAEKMHAFLIQRGVPAFAVVDDRGGAVNNPPLYLVGVNRGVTGEEFRNQSAARTELEAQIRRLGKVWQSEHRGTTDFSRTAWERKR